VRGGLVVIAATLVAPGTARAGRTFFGWLQGTEVIPERGAEIQTFVDEENFKSHEGDASETHWWVSPFIGITDQLELGLPVELAWERGTGTNLANYGAELRYRLVTQDPVDKPAFAPLVRVGLKRLVTGARDTWQPEADVVGSWDSGDLQLLGDVGMVGAIGPDAQEFELRSGAGVSLRVLDDVRIGGEVFAAVPFEDTDTSWVVAGPNVAWTHGRSWISAAYGIGLVHIRDAPRLDWGIAF
jgi:hypothetical protein